MKITIRYFEGCPNWQVASERLAAVVAASGVEAEIDFDRVETPDEAERSRFSGSPTLLFDGVDPFPAEGSSFGLTCRVYQTEDGLEGSPSFRQLQETIERFRRGEIETTGS